jgi:hypothetical protein
MTRDLTPFDNPFADIVEVQRDDGLDVVAVVGKQRALAFVSITDSTAIRLRLRDGDVWLCDEHRVQPCRHSDDVRHALAHLEREDRQGAQGGGGRPLPTPIRRTGGEGSATCADHSTSAVGVA